VEKVGGPRRTRTCDPLIKRSLTPPTVDEFRILRVADHGKTMQRVTRIRNPRATRGGEGPSPPDLSRAGVWVVPGKFLRPTRGQVSTKNTTSAELPPTPVGYPIGF